MKVAQGFKADLGPILETQGNSHDRGEAVSAPRKPLLVGRHLVIDHFPNGKAWLLPRGVPAAEPQWPFGKPTLQASTAAFHHRSAAPSCANLTWVEGLLASAGSEPVFHQKSLAVLDPPDVGYHFRRKKCAQGRLTEEVRSTPHRG
jgi:hypothetical protein